MNPASGILPQNAMLPPPVTDADGRRIRLRYTSREAAAATPRRLKVWAVLGILLFLSLPLWAVVSLVMIATFGLGGSTQDGVSEQFGDILFRLISIVGFAGWLPVIWYAYPRRAAAAVAAHRLARGQCAGCLYPLRDVPINADTIRCPECGAKWPASANGTDSASPSPAE